MLLERVGSCEGPFERVAAQRLLMIVIGLAVSDPKWTFSAQDELRREAFSTSSEVGQRTSLAASVPGMLTHEHLGRLAPYGSALDHVVHATQREPLKQSLKSSFAGLSPASTSASRAARGASRKRDTQCELALRRELWSRGLRYRLCHPGLPGRPDIVFPMPRLVVFCDGDFWHGRHLEARVARLARGHNPAYWVAKVRRNAQRDTEHTQMLKAMGWVVLRFWEKDIQRDVRRIADQVVSVIAQIHTTARDTT
jgi:DNA mismatch endonuclease (patch repair protein)